MCVFLVRGTGVSGLSWELIDRDTCVCLLASSRERRQWPTRSQPPPLYQTLVMKSVDAVILVANLIYRSFPFRCFTVFKESLAWSSPIQRHSCAHYADYIGHISLGAEGKVFASASWIKLCSAHRGLCLTCNILFTEWWIKYFRYTDKKNKRVQDLLWNKFHTEMTRLAKNYKESAMNNNFKNRFLTVSLFSRRVFITSSNALTFILLVFIQSRDESERNTAPASVL